jgi:hypothetical protein
MYGCQMTCVSVHHKLCYISENSKRLKAKINEMTKSLLHERVFFFLLGADKLRPEESSSGLSY